jgi:hypothetical protein
MGPVATVGSAGDGEDSYFMNPGFWESGRQSGYLICIHYIYSYSN